MKKLHPVATAPHRPLDHTPAAFDPRKLTLSSEELVNAMRGFVYLQKSLLPTVTREGTRDRAHEANYTLSVFQDFVLDQLEQAVGKRQEA